MYYLLYIYYDLLYYIILYIYIYICIYITADCCGFRYVKNSTSFFKFID